MFRQPRTQSLKRTFLSLNCYGVPVRESPDIPTFFLQDSVKETTGSSKVNKKETQRIQWSFITYSHIGKRETIHEASDAFSAHSDMLRSLSVPEARALTSSDGGHVLPLYPSVQLFMNPQNLSENRDKSLFQSDCTSSLIRLFTHNLLQAVIGWALRKKKETSDFQWAFQLNHRCVKVVKSFLNRTLGYVTWFEI